MSPTKNNSPKFAFFYLLSLVSLIFLSLGVGMIAFQIINKNISDPLWSSGNDFSLEILKTAISFIIIATPVYFILAHLIYRHLFSGQLEKEAPVRKWLTYFIVFVSSVVILGVLIGVINSFLNGELTSKFILKSLTVIILAGIVCSYYLYDIRRDQILNHKDRTTKIFLIGSLAIVIIVFVGGLFFAESPTTTRNRRLDEATVNNCMQIESALNNYYNLHQSLPDTITNLSQENSFFLDPASLKNSATNQAIEYKKVDSSNYTLCSEFQTANNNSSNNNSYRYGDPKYFHKNGHQCFWLTVIDNQGRPINPVNFNGEPIRSDGSNNIIQ